MNLERKYLSDSTLLRHFTKDDHRETFYTDLEGMKGFANEVQEVIESRDDSYLLDEIKSAVKEYVRDRKDIKDFSLDYSRITGKCTVTVQRTYQ